MKYGLCIALLFADAVYGAHPLITEDTGTQGKGGWQLEVNGERNRDRVDEESVRASQAAVVLSYGFIENADLQVGIPYTRHQGKGDAAIDVKWRFWQAGELSFGLKPGITVPTGRDERGLGAGRATWGSLAIFSYEPEAWAFHSHVGYRHNRNTLGQRESLKHVSAAMVFKAAPLLRLLVDLSFDTNPDPGSDTTVRQTIYGVIYSLTRDLDLDAGLRRGNEPAIDRAVMAGLTLRW